MPKLKEEITEEEILEVISQMVEKWGSQKRVADQLEISTAYMNDILQGARHVSDKVARRLGYSRIVKYKRDGSIIEKGSTT